MSNSMVFPSLPKKASQTENSESEWAKMAGPVKTKRLSPKQLDAKLRELRGEK